MQILHYKKNDQIDFMTFAGQDMDIATDGNIRVECFPQKDFIQIPNLEAKIQGTGKLDDLLKEIEEHYKMPLVFVNFVNARLEQHIRKLGYKIKEY